MSTHRPEDCVGISHLHCYAPATAGQDRNATTRAREIGAAAAADLRCRVAPHFLRREKKDVFPSGGDTGAGSAGADGASSSAGLAAGSSSGSAVAPSLTARKIDMVVWLKLKPLQRHVYKAFLCSDAVKQALNETRCAFDSSCLCAFGCFFAVCNGGGYTVPSV